MNDVQIDFPLGSGAGDGSPLIYIYIYHISVCVYIYIYIIIYIYTHMYTYNDDLMCIIYIYHSSVFAASYRFKLDPSAQTPGRLFALDEFVTVGRGLRCEGGRF